MRNFPPEADQQSKQPHQHQPWLLTLQYIDEATEQIRDVAYIQVCTWRPLYGDMKALQEVPVIQAANAGILQL
jgi:hypothetical protein